MGSPLYGKVSSLFLLLLAAVGVAVRDGEDSQPTPDSQDNRDRVYYPGDTEHVRPLARKLAGNIWLDQNAIWTSHIHITTKNAAVWAAFGALTAGVILTDRRTAHV
jgi:hypothetical protein